MKTLILGNGLLGGELSFQTDWGLVCRDIDRIDITNPSSYEVFLSYYDQVVNCIGYTNTLQPHKEPAWSINYVGVIDLVDLCNQYGKKLIHISTDYVYANSVSNASEDDVPVHYPNWYAYSKIMADGYVQARCSDYLMIRTSYKPRPYPWEGAWKNRKGNFDYVDKIASIIISLINKGASGIYNVGTEVKTMYQLAVQTKPNCLKMQDEVIPSDVTMNLDKLNNDISHNNI